MKSKLKIITAFIIGAVVFGSLGVYAASKIYSNQVEIDKTGGKLANIPGTKLQDALDYLYEKAQNVGIDSNSIDIATLNTNSTKTVLASSKGVCINRNNKLNCFKINNWAEEQNHIQQVFSDISCDVSSSQVDCYASDFYCLVNASGRVRCYDGSLSSQCDVGASGYVYCPA